MLSSLVQAKSKDKKMNIKKIVKSFAVCQSCRTQYQKKSVPCESRDAQKILSDCRKITSQPYQPAH